MTSEPPDWVQILRQCGAVERHHEAGDRLLRRGEVASSFLVVVNGEAEVLGHPDLNTIAAVGPYGLIGELGLLTRRPRSHDVVATTHLHALHGDIDTFTTALDHDPVRTHFGQVAARRLAEAVSPIAWTAKDGSDIILRPLLPRDRDAYLQALGQVSTETLRSRFFTPVQPSQKVIDHLLDVDFVTQFAWIVARAETPDVGLGIGRFIADQEHPGRVELAVTVLDGAQGTGLGTTLVGAVATAAYAMGYREMSAFVLSTNKPMRAILDKCGARWRHFEPGVVETVVPLGDVTAALTTGLTAELALATKGLAIAASLALS